MTENLQLKYTMLGGDEGMTNPQEKIKEINKAILQRTSQVDERILSLRHTKINYQALQEDLNIGITELWGERDTQEDRVVVGEMPGFEKLADEERKLALKKLVQMLQNNVTQKQLGHYQGATLCVAIIVTNQIYVVNLGDSCAFLVKIKANGEAHIERLNKELHNPTTRSEKQRIEALGHRLFADRIGGSLAVSRAIGDNQFEDQGLSHEPDIYCYSLDGSQSEAVFLILACDGLTEMNVLTEAEIAQRVAKNKNKLPDHIATELALSAYNAGSNDNISVIVIPVDEFEQRIKYAAIFDGHGGDEVSEELSHTFAEKFQSSIQYYLK